MSARAATTLVIVIALAGFALDQATKALALATLDPADPQVLLGGLLTLRLISNPGAAFSMGEGFTIVFTLISIAALLLVSIWLVPRIRHVGWAVGTGLLLAGILGNLTDRLVRAPGFMHGHVVDFLQLPYFAVINVADICITFAAVILIWLLIVRQVEADGRSARQARPEKAA